MKNLIKTVEVNQGFNHFFMSVGVGGVSKIIDKSLVYPDSICVIFQGLDKNDKILTEFINGVFIVEYFKEGES